MPTDARRCYWCDSEATKVVVIEKGRTATVRGRKGYKPPKTVDACETHAHQSVLRGLEVK